MIETNLPAPPRYIQNVRYFLTRRLPEANSILLVESGSRGLVERLIPSLRATWGDEISIDLVTCYPTLPRGFEPQNTHLYHIAEYRGSAGRTRLARELAAKRYALLGIVCSDERLPSGTGKRVRDRRDPG